jgi:hypothetical protein
MAKNISRGLHTYETLHLRNDDGDTVYIEAYGTAENVHISLKPYGNGHIDLDGVLTKNSILDAEEINVNEIRINTQNVPVLSYEQGVSGDYFTVNSLELLDGVDGGAGKAGMRVERGLEPPAYMLFDESDNLFKFGEMGNLRTVLTISEPPVSGNGVVFAQTISGATSLQVDDGFTYDSETNTLTLSGSFMKNGSTVLNRDESDARYLEHEGVEDVSGNKTFHDNVTINGTTTLNSEVAITDTVEISADVYKNNSPILNRDESDARYLEHVGLEDISGNKTFHGNVMFNDGFDVTGDVAFVSDDITFSCGEFSVSAANAAFFNNLTKDGVEILNQDEMDLRYVNAEGTETINGDKAFSGDVGISGVFDVSNVSSFMDASFEGEVTFSDDATFLGNCSVTGGELTKDGVDVLNENESDAKYVNLTDNQSISGDKTFMDSVVLSMSGGPSAPSGQGDPGQLKWDTEYLYLCYQPNAWGRVQLEKIW